ncbi:signal transduction histidine kinase [Streptomyces sp. V3I8]|jgi:signal transduction histidine kinase|uniref:sensor histidine kinase n=1 Tax=Streptomyces sp. V3I8 TaxID=3042279 RepID=UPI002782C839|nr:histidine kinase [Streptomyces sp. V3I8]MDQ1041244.1 signal transduction histidine kinase [Streptomyces sp. V3I8]
MNHAFGTRPGGTRILWCLAAVLLPTLLVLEGLDTRSAVLAVAWVVSGALALAALAVPADRFLPVVTAATAASLLLTVLNAQLSQRPEHTYGFVESCALLLTVARALWQRPLLQAVAPAAGATLAASVAFFRLPAPEYGVVGALSVGFTWAGAVLMAVLGLCLRLLDTLRARDHQAVLQAQRLEYARELHDFVGHHITAIIAHTKAVRYISAAGNGLEPTELDRMLAGIEKAGSQAMDSMRAVVSVLRDTEGSAARYDGDLGELRTLLTQFSATGPDAMLTLDPRLTMRRLPPGVGTAAHHVVRESLTNIRKHGQRATVVTVDVRLHDDEAPHLRVSVTDNGAGGTAPAGRPEHDTGLGRRPGYGLLGLAERVEMLGGRFEAGRRGSVWAVSADFPLPSVPRDAPAADELQV